MTLGNLLLSEFNALSAEEASLNNQVSSYLNLIVNSPNAHPVLVSQLQAVIYQDGLIQTEVQSALNQINAFIGGVPFQPDQLTGGAGTDTFYGNVQGATVMGGGTGSQAFYNYNATDTIHGNATGVNTLVLQDNLSPSYQPSGTNTIILSQDTGNVNAVDYTVNGQTLLVGDTGLLSGIQTLALQLGSGNDTVTVNLTSLSPGLTGLAVMCGSGNDAVDASKFTGNETLAGGSGNDVIKVGAILGGASHFTGTPTTELDLTDTADLPVVVSRSSGIPTLSVGPTVIPLGTYSAFGKLVMVGGAGNDTFTTDGSVPNVVLKGGSGSTVFNMSGGTTTLMGGSGSNSFNVTGPGNYTIVGGGPAVGPATPSTPGVAAPAPTGVQQISATLSQAYHSVAATAVGT